MERFDFGPLNAPYRTRTYVGWPKLRKAFLRRSASILVMDFTEFVAMEKLSPFVGARFALIRWSSGRFLALLSAWSGISTVHLSVPPEGDLTFGTNLEKKARRGMPELVTAIDEYIAHHKTKPNPFIWTKKAGDILQKVIHANSR